MKKQRILITGADGNIGEALKSYLIKNKYNIFSLIRSKKRFVGDIIGDLNDHRSLLNATKNIDVVIHLAGLIKGNKKSLKKINILGTKNLIGACKKNKVKKIIFMSSLDIKFKTFYGFSKLKAEELIKKSNLKYIILRPTTIYGEGFKTGINSLVRIVKKIRILPIFGSGKNLYQPIYIGDLVSLIKQIIDADKFNNKIYFVGGKEIINFDSLIDLISLNLKKRMIKIHIPIKIKTFIFDKTCDNQEIEREFDFKPISIIEGIRRIL